MLQAKKLRNLIAATFTTFAAMTSSASADAQLYEQPIPPMDVACVQSEFTAFQAVVCLSAIQGEVSSIHAAAMRAYRAYSAPWAVTDPPFDIGCAYSNQLPYFRNQGHALHVFAETPRLASSYQHAIRQCLSGIREEASRRNVPNEIVARAEHATAIINTVPRIRHTSERLLFYMRPLP